MKVSVRQEQWELVRPLPTAHGDIHTRHAVVVTVEQDGSVGHGEAAPLPGFGLESYEEALEQLERWASGGSLPETRAAAAAAQAAVGGLTASTGGWTLDQYLTDGRTTTTPLRVQALIGSHDATEVSALCEAAVESGYAAVKVKVGATDPANDVERITAARAALPADRLLRLDANQAWDVETATAVLGAVADLGIDLVEEPTSDAAEWKPLHELGLRLAVDEQFGSPITAPALLAMAHVEALVLKPAVLGGPITTFRIAERAAELGKGCVVSSFIDGPVGLRTARDLALAVDPMGIHGVGTAPLLAAPLPADVTPIGGALHPPEGDFVV